MASHAHTGPCARLNIMRLNAARLNYYEAPITFASIGGIDRSKNVRIEGAAVEHALNDAPDTAHVRVHGFVPLAGQDFVLSTGGDRATAVPLFRGKILETTVVYESRKNNVAYDLQAIDPTWWVINRRRVITQYAGLPADALVHDIITRFAPDATRNHVQAGLPIIDQISFTNETVAQCLTAICERIGAYWYLDYQHDLHVFLQETPDANPITDAQPHGASDLQLAEDLSQCVTRVIARGGGGAAFVDVAAGAAEIPVTDDGWYSDAGGIVEAAAQRFTYTGVKGRGGTGALVGVAALPSSPPRVSVANGSGLGTGTYRWAQTFTSASGETLPGPLATATTGGTAAPLLKTVARSRGSLVMPPAMTIGGSYAWRIAVLFDGGGYALGPPTNYYTVDDMEWELYFGVAVVDPVTGWYYNPGIMASGPAKIQQTQIYRTTNGGATWYNEKNFLSEAVATVTGWNSAANNLSDGEITAKPTYPTGPIATFGAAQLRDLQPAPAGMTGTKLYRTAVNGAQLKLLATNPPVDVLDSTPDASLGANAPTTDTAGVLPSNAQVAVGATALPVTSITPFVNDGGTGWAEVGNIPIRYTGASAGQLTGIPATGVGSITATVRHGAQVLVVARLVGVGWPVAAKPLKAGDAVTLRVEVEDVAAQRALADRFSGAGAPLQHGVVEEVYSDSRMTRVELEEYARALLSDRKEPRLTLRFVTRDPTVEVGRLITITIASPPISGTFRIQRVAFDEIAITGGWGRTDPRRTVEATNKLFTFTDLLRRLRGREGGAS